MAGPVTAAGPSVPLDALGAQRGDNIEKTAQEFEAVFLAQAFTQIFETVEIGEMGGGHAEEQWRSMLASAMADEVAAQGRTGIADQIAEGIRTRIAAERAAE